jgi:hypothetical protein
MNAGAMRQPGSAVIKVRRFIAASEAATSD